MTISDRALLRAVLWPSLAVLAALCAIFAGYSVSRYLADAAQGASALGLVLRLIGLRVIVALEVLLPLALFLGLIIGLGGLYAGNEMTAWQAAGLSRARMLRPLLLFVAATALLVAALAVFGRPWAYGALYASEVRAQTRLDFDAITPGRFYTGGDAVIYARAKSEDGQRLDGVFARFVDDARPVVVRARHMRRSRDADRKPTIAFARGHLYAFDPRGEADRSVAFTNLQWHLQPGRRVRGTKRKAASSARLLAATDRADIAERQWRFSRGPAALFLGLLGIVLARSAPRRARAGRALAAAVGFGCYYGAATVARSWVEQGIVPVFPGVYGLDAAVGVLACALLFGRRATHY